MFSHRADHGAMNLDTCSVPATQIESQSALTVIRFNDRFTTSSGSIVSSDALTISTGIIEPPGRPVIFLISAPKPRKRQNTDKGFVGNNNPSICTFAQSFNLAEEQLFIGGVPLFYDGEDYKELAAGPSPPAGAVTRLFTAAGRSLQVDLPGRDVGFCQARDGRVYVIFASGPVGCEAVTLEVYDERQCQNGRLVGVDTTSSVDGSTITETTSLSSESIASSRNVVQTLSAGPASQTTEPEASTVASSGATESTPISLTTSIAVSEVSTLSPVSSSVLEEPTSNEVIPSITPSSLSTSTEAEELLNFNGANVTRSSETTEAAESSSEESTSAATTKTTTEAGQFTTEDETTVEAAIESETTTAEAATTTDTTTAVFTTQESSTVATTAEETTTEDLTTIESTIDTPTTTTTQPPP
ncbi:hypothetical protein LB506_009188 [Fusarium annulatum]|nr:hypothetical protein LB506_009188 [Fusarium annulatum]